MLKFVWRLFLLAVVVSLLLAVFSMTPRTQFDTTVPELSSRLREWGKAIIGEVSHLFQGATALFASVVN